MKDKYEISIWEDCLDYGSGVGSIGNYEFYGANVPAGYATSTFPDKKIAVIGSDTMTSPCRAEEPKLVQNINGTNTFTFKMRYVYNDHGEEKKNPFLSLLVNERKIKVFWKNEWYDLVIKDCQENSSDKSITYTCKDLFINELSKNGFNLEFDTELMNNTGSAQELAAAVLEGTDWQVDEQNSDIVFQESEEPVYECELYNSLSSFTAKGLNRANGQEVDVTINGGQNILIFESVYSTHPEGNQLKDFQFWWTSDNSFETDGSNMLVTNGQCLTISNCRWNKVDDVYKIQEKWYDEFDVAHYTTVCEVGLNPSISLNYRAKRLIASQKVEADQLTGKQCLVYESTTTPKKKYYAFSETEYSSANLITNCITNSKDFNNVLGWIYDGVVSTVCPAINEDHLTPYDGKGYLYLPAGKKAFNNGLSDSHSFMENGFIKGEEYVFKIKARRNNNGRPSYDVNDPLGGYCDLDHEDHGTHIDCSINVMPQVYKYKLEDGVCTVIGSSIFDVENPTQFGDWITYIMTCKQSISYNDIVKKTATSSGYGFFIDNNGAAGRFPDAPASTSIWIEEVQFFKRTVGVPLVQEYSTSKTYMENDYIKITDGDTYKIYRCIRSNKNIAPTATETIGDYDTYWYYKADNEHPEELGRAIVIPGSYSTESLANVVWKIYQVKSSVTDPADIVYLFSGSEEDFNDFVNDENNHITPSYGPNGKYEKVRSITGKQSNRFNLLQSIAETFQVWIKFVIGHDAVGHTKIVSGKPDKKIVFLNEVGTRNGLSFTYGIDLKSITRTINSDQITTKVIVPQNNNEFGKDGFCSIARAKDNYPMVNYILNFDYYFSHNLLSKDMVMNDLYYIPADVDVIADDANYLGYYTRLHVFNNRYDAAARVLLERNNEYVKAKSKLDYLDATIKSATQEKEKLKNDLANYAGYQTYDQSKVEEYLQGRGKTDEVAQNAWKTMWALNGQLEVYEAQKSNISLLITQLTTIINAQTAIQEDCVTKIKQIDDKFFSKYAHFLQEGSWSSDQYYDDDLYYFDALGTSYTSSRPQVSYNISVLRISSIKGFENKVFHLGDISYVQDTEFFGYQADGITPYKEKVLISELTSNFDAPQNDAIKVQNYKTQFEDLFQRIAAATQSLQFSSGAYDNTVNNFTHGGTLKGDSLQGSIDENDGLKWAADNNTVLFTKEGLMIMDPQNPAKIVKITADGIQFTEDGGATWSPAITGKGTEVGSIGPGKISTDHISIMGGKYPTFNWDSYGINAYSYTTDSSGNIDSVDDKHFVRFDKYGLYGINKTTDPSFASDWRPDTEASIWNQGQFGLTWNGFFLNKEYGYTKDSIHHNTSIEISSENDFCITDTADDTTIPVQRIKLGNISTSTLIPEFGLQVKDAGGNRTFLLDDSGNVQLKSVLRVGPFVDERSTRIIGNFPDSVVPSTQQVINACNSFIVYADGSVEAKNIRIEGGSIDASASIIGEIGGFRVVGDRLVSTNTTGPTLILNGGAGTISGLYTEVTGTLTSGSTSITLSSACIESTSKVMPWFSEYGVVAKTMEIDNGHVTMTFDARQSDLGIKLEVR